MRLCECRLRIVKRFIMEFRPSIFMTLGLTLAAIVCGGRVVAQQQNGKKLSTLVIDPGHGGKDPGAIGSKFREKNVVLSVALKLGKMINDSLPELSVVYTRDKDVFVPLDKRAETAVKNSADIFISIHANSSSNKTVYGAETFLLGQHRSKENLEVAQKENSVITLEDDYTKKYEGFDPTQPESIITFAGLQSDYINKSVDMAVMIQKGFAASGRSDRGVNQSGFLVLREVPMPSVLVELGFISNKEEEAYMASADGSMTLASAIFNAIRKFKAEYDGRQVVLKAETESAKPTTKKVNLWPDGINFRVQIVASGKARDVDTLTFSPLSSVSESGVIKYMVGLCRTEDEAQKIKEGLKYKYPDCFIVAFDGKEKISIRSARRKLRAENND